MQRLISSQRLIIPVITVVYIAWLTTRFFNYMFVVSSKYHLYHHYAKYLLYVVFGFFFFPICASVYCLYNMSISQVLSYFYMFTSNESRWNFKIKAVGKSWIIAIFTSVSVKFYLFQTTSHVFIYLFIYLSVYLFSCLFKQCPVIYMCRLVTPFVR